MSDDDDDWFEEALEDDENTQTDGTDGQDSPFDDDTDTDSAFDDTDDDSTLGNAFDSDDTEESDFSSSDETSGAFGDDDTDESDAFGGDDTGGGFDSDDTNSAFDSTDDSSGAFDNGDDTDAFGDDDGASDGDAGGAFGSDADAGGAFGGGDDAETSGGGGAFGDDDSGGSPFGDDGGDSPFGGGGGDSPFEDDFESAFGGGGGGDNEFDDEDFESDIPRIDLGIEGLDNMIQGGVPQKHLIVTIGSAGTGKTTFGLQFLHHGLQNGEKSVFITLEQSKEAIMATANERGWDFDRYEEDDQLAVVDLDPVEMANSLDNIRGELPTLIRDFGADRLVLDSVSLLEMMYDNQAKRRTEVFDFTRSLKRSGVTTFLTSEASESNPYASRHGIIEYLTDAVFILQYVRSETRETRMAVEIQKIRNANHSREKKPYEITLDGISVYQQANIF